MLDTATGRHAHFYRLAEPEAPPGAVNQIERFIDEKECDLFQTPGRYVERAVAEIRPEGSGNDLSRAGPSEDIGTQAVDWVGEVVHGARQPKRAMFIVDVFPSDGMSWSAERVRTFLAEANPGFRKVCLSARLRSGELPLIADVLGRRQFLQQAARSGFADCLPLLGVWAQLTPVLLAAAAALLAQWGALQVAGSRPGGVSPAAWISFLGVLVVAELLRRGAAFFTTWKDQTRSVERFVDRLKRLEHGRGEAVGGRAAYDALVGRLAARLMRETAPRLVIVDGFERLDPTTRDVAFRYLGQISALDRGLECWIVFESRGELALQDFVLLDSDRRDLFRPRLFEQLLLDREGRRRAVEAAGRPDAALRYTTIGRICRYDNPKDDHNFRRLEQHRVAHPAKRGDYDALTLLALLSLTSDPGEHWHDLGPTSSGFSQKKGLASEVLFTYLYGSDRPRESWHLSKPVIQDRFRQIAGDFDDLVQVRGAGTSSLSIRVLPEVRDVVESHQGALALPGHELGHLFWSLYWFQDLPAQRTEAFWLRRLGHHLVRARLAAFHSQALYEEARQRVVEACLFAISGCLRTCVFELVVALLEKCAAHLEEGDYEPGALERRRFVQLCWQAFAVLGDDAVLQLVLDAEPTRPKRVPAEQRYAATSPEELFLNTVSLEESQRNLLRQAVLRRRASVAHADEAADFALARAAWLSAVPSVSDSMISSLRLLRTLEESQSRLGPLLEGVQARLRDDEREPQPLDLVTLSIALFARTLIVAQAASVSAVEAPASRRVLSHLIRDLCDAADATVVIAVDVKERLIRSSEASHPTDLLLAALVREVCAMALAVILVPSRAGGLGWMPGLRERFNELAALANDGLDAGITPVPDDAVLLGRELAVSLDGLLRSCAFTWRRFHLDALHDLLNLRRAHLRAMAEPAHRGDQEVLMKELTSIGGAVSQGGFLGILANLTAASFPWASHALASEHLGAAVRAVRLGRVGRVLRREVIMIAIAGGFRPASSDAGDLAAEFLQHEAGGESPLRDYLRGLPPGAVAGVCMKFLNAFDAEHTPGVRSGLQELIERYAEQDAPEEIRAEIGRLVEFTRIEDRIATRAARDPSEVADEVDAAFHAWAGFEASWHYAGLLSLFLNAGYGTPELRARAIAAVRDEQADPGWNSRVNLSMALIERSNLGEVPAEDRDAVYSYLRENLARHVERLRPDSVLKAYQQLYAWDPVRREEYGAQIDLWAQVILHRSFQRRFPMLAADWKDFLIFRELWETCRLWGLAADAAHEDLHARLTADLEVRQEAVKRWREGGTQVPAPFYTDPEGARVGADFLVLGSYLFGPPFDSDESLEAAREAFNARAREVVPRLMRHVIGLRVPDFVKSLLRQHHDRYQTQASRTPGSAGAWR